MARSSSQQQALTGRGKSLGTGGALLKRGMTNHASRYDLVVLGAGPAGVKAAVEAASRGYRVAVVEPKASLTGTPTGTHSKCIREAILQGKTNWEDMQAMISRVDKDGREAAARLLRTFHVEILRGSGSFVDDSTIRFTPVEGDPVDLKTDAAIIATGSRANRLPMVPFDIPGVFDSDTITQIQYIPKRMVVQGGGIVGLEYANMFAKLGAEVVVIEFFDKILQMLDIDLQKAVLDDLKDSKVEIFLKTGIKSVEAAAGSTPGLPLLRVDAGDRIFECDCFLSATGRSGFTAGLDLEKIGVKTGRGNMIVVDENQYTGVGNIYAVGDVAAGNLATIGQAQAVRAVRKVFGSGQFTLQDKPVKPFVVWTIPEIAWVGMNEKEAESKEINYGTVRAEYGRTVRGMVGDSKGFLKLIYDRSGGKVLGVHIAGDSSCELINFAGEMVNHGSTIFDLLQYVFPAVTLHVLYNIAAAEAKIRIAGVKTLSESSAWSRIRRAIKDNRARSGSTLSERDFVRAAFEVVGVAFTGLLQADDLRKAMKSFGLQLVDDEVAKMVKESGVKGNQLLDCDAFLRALAA